MDDLNVVIAVKNAVLAHALEGVIDLIEPFRAAGVALDAPSLVSRTESIDTEGIDIDVVIIDQKLLAENGRGILQDIRERHPKARILQVGDCEPISDDASNTSTPVVPTDATLQQWTEALRQICADTCSPSTSATYQPEQKPKVPAAPSPATSVTPRGSSAARALARSLPGSVFQRATLIYLFLAALNVASALIFLTNTEAGSESAWDGVPLDDVWIHFVYARNLAEHGWFYFNPGVPEAGFTSPLWVILLAIGFKVLMPFGLGPVLIAKVLATVLAVVCAGLAYRLVVTHTRSQWAGIIAGAIVSVDPTFSFSKVSGMEVSLFASLMLLSVFLFGQQRIRAAGIAAGLMVLARPEGYLLTAIMAGVLGLCFLRWLSDSTIETENPLRDLARFLVPTVLIVLPMVVFYYSVNGTAFPNTFLVKRQEVGLVNLANLSALWGGYVTHLAYFGGTAWIASILLLASGTVACWRGKGLYSLPSILAPWALYYGFSVTLRFAPGVWTFYTRRYVDPAIPLLAVLLTIGIWRFGPLIAGVRSNTRKRWWPRKEYALTAPVLLISTALIGAQGASLWRSLPGEFSWNTRNVNDVNVTLGRWAGEHLPADAHIAIGDAGAVRYLGPGTMLDLVALNSHEALGRNSFELMLEKKVDFAIVFPSVAIDGWAFAHRIYEATTPRNTILTGPTLVVYRIDRNPEFADKKALYQLETRGWEMIDTLDVGDEADESAHNFELLAAKALVSRVFKTSEEAVISDQGRVYLGRESFTVASRPGLDLRIVKRYDAVIRGTVKVYADEALVGEWGFPERQYQFGEDSFVIPGRFISGEQTRLTFEFVPGSSEDINSFYYWFFVPQSLALS